MFKKRIPTIIGLILLLLGATSGVMFINHGTNFLPRAAPEYTPQKVKLTNIADNGLVISWVTKQPTIGYLRYSDNPLNLATTLTDDRDQLSGSSNDYRTHYVSLQNLTANTTYYFKLGSYQNQLYDNNGEPFSFTTPTASTNLPVTDSVYGTVVTQVDTPAEGAIVYLSLPNGTPLSALVQQNGNWTANLSLSRTQDLTDFLSYDPATAKINILVQSDSDAATLAQTTTDNDQPVPRIVLGTTNDFITTSTTPPPSPTADTVVPSPEPQTQTNKFPLDPITVSDDPNLTVNSIPPHGDAPTLQQIDLAYAATPAASPTPTSTPTPTITPKPTPRANVATQSANIVAGSTSPGLMTIVLGLAVIMLGSYFQLGNKKRN